MGGVQNEACMVQRRVLVTCNLRPCNTASSSRLHLRSPISQLQIMFLCLLLPHSTGALLRREGDGQDLSVADGLLIAALRYEPDSHEGWYNLGLARKAQGHIAEGEQHLYTAMELAAAAPAVSCSKLPLLI